MVLICLVSAGRSLKMPLRFLSLMLLKAAILLQQLKFSRYLSAGIFCFVINRPFCHHHTGVLLDHNVFAELADVVYVQLLSHSLFEETGRKYISLVLELNNYCSEKGVIMIYTSLQQTSDDSAMSQIHNVYLNVDYPSCECLYC